MTNPNNSQEKKVSVVVPTLNEAKNILKQMVGQRQRFTGIVKGVQSHNIHTSLDLQDIKDTSGRIVISHMHLYYDVHFGDGSKGILDVKDAQKGDVIEFYARVIEGYRKEYDSQKGEYIRKTAYGLKRLTRFRKLE